VVLMHADGENRLDWQWVLDGLASRCEVFAPDLPGFDGTGLPADCSPGFYATFVRDFLDALRLDQPSSWATRWVVSRPCTWPCTPRTGSPPVGRSGHAGERRARRLTVPGIAEAAVRWAATPLGAAQRAVQRVPLLFADPTRVPPPWLAKQYRLARIPGFLPTALARSAASSDQQASGTS
jgi:hypothetical protein